jgi:hypothetical protein
MSERERERERDVSVRFKAYCTVNDGQSYIITFTTNPKPRSKLTPLFLKRKNIMNVYCESICHSISYLFLEIKFIKKLCQTKAMHTAEKTIHDLPPDL